MVVAVVASIGASGIGAATAVDDSSVTTIDELRAASSSCTGTSADPTTITLEADIVDPAAQVDVTCHAVLSLAGHDLTVRNVVINSGQALTVADTGAGGTLTADAGETSDVAGIQNTGATLTVAGGTVAATGGLHAAGIGGGPSGDGGTTTINGGTVIATTVNAEPGGSSAVGPGDGGASFGSLWVTGGVLQLPSGFLRVPDSAGVEITVGVGGVIDGSGGPGATYATVTGAGQIDNRGRILLPAEKVTADAVTVTGRHYAVSFDTQGGSDAPAAVTVLADTFDHGARSLPTSPTKPGATFAGWNTAADGSGFRVTAISPLRGSSLDGTPVPITAYAQWRPVPAITGIAPSSGPIEGGTEVVITGTGFSGASKVTFGLAGPASSFTVDSATQITAVAPPSATTGSRAITVTTAGGISAYVDEGRFTYTAPAPAITAIAPSSGPIEGGTEVVITGTGFSGASKVTFGLAGPASSFTVDSATQITAVAPPSATTGSRAITVTTAGGISAYVDEGRFTYTAPAPAITAIAPSSGPIEGGTEVVITGTGFSGASKVTFGLAGPASSFTVDSATQITAVAPPSSTIGARAITVTTAGGISAYVDADLFTYTAPAPTITAIAPSSGPIEGGTEVVITGTGFSGASKVTFGLAGPASSFTVDSATQVTAVAPPSLTTGIRAITVKAVGGVSAYSYTGRFTYTAPAPAITAIAPSSGPIEGGTSVVITGTGFSGATKVTFGLAGPASSFTVDSATQITAVAPPSSTIGARAITVTGVGGVSDYVDADVFTYTAPAPTITAIAPSSGPIEGGTSVVITGTGFTGATKVTFGLAGPASSFTVDSATQITAVAPPSSTIGARAITVKAVGGVSAYVDADLFTYTAPAPTITAIAPSAGPLSGGTSVVISGTGFTDVARVTFGLAGPATSFTVDSATQITAVAPPSLTTGIRAITVKAVGGVSAYSYAGRFTYAAPPAITAMAGSAGPLGGGKTVVITGTGFTGATEVTFGDAGPAASFTVDSAARITATSPAAADIGARHVTVTTPGGTTAAVDADLFTYVARPVITEIAPAAGPTVGGTSLVITGTDFTGATEVAFGDAGPAASFTVDSATQITATSPAAADIGARHVTVTTDGGTTAKVDADLFTYTAVITRVAPSAGPMSGGTRVVITGTGFTDATEVTFGDAGPAASFTVDSGTQITAISPAAPDLGPRNIRVSTADGAIAAVDAVADRFTFTDPPDACGDLIVKSDGSTWACSFVDDFDGEALDTTKWGVQETELTGFKTGATCYVNSPDNVDVQDGELLLTVRRESEDRTCDGLLGLFSTPYTGGMVGTRGRFSQTYGRFEVRAKYPDVTVPGLHGGFWAMPRDHIYGVWPLSGELDIAEWWSNAPTQVLPTLHYLGDSVDDTGWNCGVSTPSSYHTYTMEWYPDVIRFFIDGEMCFERRWTPIDLVAPQPFDQPFSMILSMGASTLTGANKVSADTPLPATYTIDYAKVWR